MSLVARMLVITLCMNIMITFASISMISAGATTSAMSLGDNDALIKFLSIDTVNEEINPSAQFNFKNGNEGTIPTETAQGAVGLGGTLGSFIDGLKMVFDFIKMLCVALFYPMYWGSALEMPIWLQLLLFLQTAVSILSLMMTLRGLPT